MCVYNVTFPFKYIKMPSCWCKIQAIIGHLWCPRYDAADLCTHGSQLRPFSEVAPAPIFEEKARDSLWCKKHSWKQMLEAAERIIYGSTWSISTYKWESYCFPQFCLTSNLYMFNDFHIAFNSWSMTLHSCLHDDSWRKPLVSLRNSVESSWMPLSCLIHSCYSYVLLDSILVLAASQDFSEFQ